MMSQDIPCLPYLQKRTMRVGLDICTSFNFPSRIRLEDKLLRISILWFTIFTFSPGEIKALRSEYFFFHNGIKLIHSHKRYPPLIVFWDSRPVSFWLAMFNKAGFNLPEK